MPRLSKIGAACLAAFGFTSGAGVQNVSASYLVVAGGGGGGASSNGGYSGSGGGAGGMQTGTTSLNPTLSYTVVVGAGGAPSTNGANSQLGALTASVGGGSGGWNLTAGGNGGSGGGGGASAGAGTGTAGQGNNGGTNSSGSPNYTVGGGGGAGAAGSNGSAGGTGGVGLTSSISGTSTYYAGGGGGAAYGSAGASGGLGGGGTGGGSTGNYGTGGTANTGGGGGGASAVGVTLSGTNGGSGIVIISYAGAQQFGGGIVTSVGGNTIHTFNTSGTLSPINSLTASYLIVAGGGGAGANSGGGGGAGGMQTGFGITIDTSSTYLVTVGAGGNGGGTGGNGTQGANSTFSMVSVASVGGGYGASNQSPTGSNPGGNGGSGGGGAYYTAGSQAFAGGTGVAGQGNAGGTSPVSYAGGGGGAGAAGSGANGGNGLTSSISGTSTYYAGGGAAHFSSPATAGLGGGGLASTSGTPNTGGGGGAWNGTGVAGSGGSGIVIISYAGSTQLMAGGTVTIVGGNVIHTFTSSGYLSPLTYVGNSLRFRSSASAYLSKTMTTPTNNLKWTFSAWIKRGSTFATENQIINAGTTGSDDQFVFTGSSQLGFYIANGGSYYLITNAVYRDPAAWYHIVFVYDSANATASNRLLLYVNGTQVTSFATALYPTQNYASQINSAVLNRIGLRSNSTSPFDGYMAEVRLIDGQALAPTAFGAFNSYGVWQPINYGGSYGTNGFYLPFSNKTSTTTLGYDFSPAGNNWTTNNISLTAGYTYDAMTDVPTLTSATAANYAVLNPLATLGVRATITNGNLTATGNNANYCAALSTIGITSGKFYFEATVTGYSGNSDQIGVLLSDASKIVSGVANPWYYSTDYAFLGNGNKYNNNASGGSAGAFTFGLNDVVGVAFDATAGTLQVNKNGGSFTTIYSSIPAGTYLFGTSTYATSDVIAANFGQQPFVYTPPTGYVGLNTYNL